MKKILILNGSPKENRGNTYVLVDNFIKGMKEANEVLEIKEYNTNSLNVNECTGCFSCWTRSPGQCIFNDDATLIMKDYIDADIIIYSTPLYYYSMTASLKKVIDRMLPLNKPYMVKKGELYTHPKRFEEKEHKFVLISTAGFPDRQDFDNLIGNFKQFTDDKLDALILCAGAELLKIEELKKVTAPFIDGVKKSGYEFIRFGKISEETKKIIENNLVDTKLFVDMANQHWNVAGETPPTEEEAHGVTNEAIENIKIDSIEKTKMFNNIKGMTTVFNANVANNMKAVLEFHFTDISESCQLKIENNQCEFLEKNLEIPTTTIKTSTKIWQDIVDGVLDGASALMEGKYKVTGDFSLMMKMNAIFPTSEEPEVRENPDRGFLKFIPPMLWLSLISFVPWYFMWISPSFLSAKIALVLSLLIYFYRKNFIELGTFDKGNVIFFSFTWLWALVDNSSFMINIGQISSLGLAIIWAYSLTTKSPLTSLYSQYGYDKTIRDSELFFNINKIITVFWVITYISQVILRILIPNNQMFLQNIVIYGLLVLAGLFTASFPNKYVNKTLVEA